MHSEGNIMTRLQPPRPALHLRLLVHIIRMNIHAQHLTSIYLDAASVHVLHTQSCVSVFIRPPPVRSFSNVARVVAQCHHLVDCLIDHSKKLSLPVVAWLSNFMAAHCDEYSDDWEVPDHIYTQWLGNVLIGFVHLTKRLQSATFPSISRASLLHMELWTPANWCTC